MRGEARHTATAIIVLSMPQTTIFHDHIWSMGKRGGGGGVEGGFSPLLGKLVLKVLFSQRTFDFLYEGTHFIRQNYHKNMTFCRPSTRDSNFTISLGEHAHGPTSCLWMLTRSSLAPSFKNALGGPCLRRCYTGQLATPTCNDTMLREKLF